MDPIRADSSHEIIDRDERLVHDWRAGQLTRLGIPGSLAEAVADRVDWHQIAALIRRGCPPRLALRIVLVDHRQLAQDLLQARCLVTHLTGHHPIAADAPGGFHRSDGVKTGLTLPAAPVPGPG